MFGSECHQVTPLYLSICIHQWNTLCQPLNCWIFGAIWSLYFVDMNSVTVTVIIYQGPGWMLVYLMFSGLILTRLVSNFVWLSYWLFLFYISDTHDGLFHFWLSFICRVDDNFNFMQFLKTSLNFLTWGSECQLDTIILCLNLLNYFSFFRLRRPVGRLTMKEQKLEGEFRYVNSRLITNRYL